MKWYCLFGGRADLTFGSVPTSGFHQKFNDFSRVWISLNNTLGCVANEQHECIKKKKTFFLGTPNVDSQPKDICVLNINESSTEGTAHGPTHTALILFACSNALTEFKSCFFMPYCVVPVMARFRASLHCFNTLNVFCILCVMYVQTQSNINVRCMLNVSGIRHRWNLFP